MTQLVVHTGTPMTGVPTVQEQLAGWREPLAAAGVAMLQKDRPEAWDRVAQQLVTGGEAQPLKKLVLRSAEAEAGTILLSSESACGPLRKAKNVGSLVAFCTENQLSCKVVLVVREQLDLLNALYCDQVLGMDIFTSFESFVDKAMKSRRYHYARAFGALLDAEDIELVAVPYSRLAGGAEATTILQAAGLPDDLIGSLPMLEPSTDPSERERPPGPVLVTATRLLNKRLTRLGLAKKRKAASVRAAERLRAHAEANAWDEGEFWGWTPELAATTAAYFRQPNGEFAAGAWRSDWLDVSPERSTAKLDLAAQSPALVVDVMGTIQQVIDELLGRPGDSEAISELPTEERAE